MPAPNATASRADTFGYICRRCSRCCRYQHIQLDPYEVARLAHARGESTRQFRAAWTIDGHGTALRQKEDGTCVFLGVQGCEVHPDRPLVCRIYPLGRHLRSDGLEFYTTLEGHPQSDGNFTNGGTVADYLASQGAEPYIAAHDGYFKWYCWAKERLACMPDTPATQLVKRDVEMLDMDSMIARHCVTTGEPEPEDIDERLRLHLKLLYDVVANLEDGHVEEDSQSEEDAA